MKYKSIKHFAENYLLEPYKNRSSVVLFQAKIVLQQKRIKIETF